MKQIILLVIITGSAASCTHVYYAPNTANIPLLSEKGETRINTLGSSGSVATINAAEFQAATALSHNVGIMFNTMFVSDDESNSDEGESGNGSYAEFAAGLFKSFDKKKKGIVEIYAGSGFGTANNYYGEGLFSKVSISKLFLQPAIGFKSKYFQIAFTPKVSFINWRVKKDNLLNYPGYFDYDKQDLDYIRQNSNFIRLEPAVTLRGGWRNFKFHVGWSYSIPNNQIMELTEIFMGSTGISFEFNLMKHRKKL